MMFRALRKDRQRPLDELLLSRTHAFEILCLEDGWKHMGQEHGQFRLAGRSWERRSNLRWDLM